MPQPAVAADFDKPLDIEVDFLAELALHGVFFFHDLTKAVHLFVVQVTHLGLGIDVGFVQYLQTVARSDTVKVLDGNPNVLFSWYVNPSDTRHIVPPSGLTLSLFVSRIGAVDSDHPAAPHYFAVAASWF